MADAVMPTRRGDEQARILQTIFDHVPVMVNLTARDGRIERVNRAWERTVGWSLADIRRDHVDPFVECYPDPGYRRYVLDFIAAAGGQWSDFKSRVRSGAVIDTTWCRVGLPDGATIGLGADLTERMRTEAELLASREQLRALAAHLQCVREEERARISRELHDDLGQMLTGIRLDLSWLGRQLARSRSELVRALVEQTRSMVTLVDEAVETVRRTATDLRPQILDHLGLAAAIEWQAADFEKRTQIPCEVTARVDPELLDPEVSTAVFRIVQEGLTNVARHADASRVRVSVHEQDGQLVVAVSDDGRGITEPERSGLGLLGMRERARLLGGDLSVLGTPGRGTTIAMRLPLAQPKT